MTTTWRSAARTITIADGHVVSDTRKDLEAWERWGGGRLGNVSVTNYSPQRARVKIIRMKSLYKVDI